MIYAMPCPVLLLLLWFISVLFFAKARTSVFMNHALLYTAWTIAWKNKFASLDARSSNFRRHLLGLSARSSFMSCARASGKNICPRNSRNKCVLREHWTSFKQWRISAVRQDTTRYRLEHDKWDVLKSSWPCKRSTRTWDTPRTTGTLQLSRVSLSKIILHSNVCSLTVYN